MQYRTLQATLSRAVIAAPHVTQVPWPAALITAGLAADTCKLCCGSSPRSLRICVSVVRLRRYLSLSHLRPPSLFPCVEMTGLCCGHTAGSGVPGAIHLPRQAVDVYIALAYLAVLRSFNMNHTK